MGMAKIEAGRAELASRWEAVDEAAAATEALVYDRYEDARLHARKALDLDPANAQAVTTLATAVAKLGAPDEALALLSPREDSVAASPRSRGDLAMAFLAAGAADKGWRYAEEYVRDDAIDSSSRWIWPVSLALELPEYARDPRLRKVRELTSALAPAGRSPQPASG